MKLNFLRPGNQKTVNEDLHDDSDDIPMPLGLTKEEWTPDMKAHFADIKKRKPEVYKKIMRGE
jgi:hypothetical protein